MSDHYQTLGVNRQASPTEIKRAYRKLASQHHPDKEGGDTATFQRIEEAYRVLSDPQQRQQYDNPQPQFNHDPFGGGFHFNFGGTGNPFQDIFTQFHRQHHQPTQTYTTVVNVTLEQIVDGDKLTLTLNGPNGPQAIQIEIPAGVENGQQIRYNTGIPNSQLLVTFRELRHSRFERRGSDLHLKYDISIWDLILGTTINIMDIRNNELAIDIKPNTKPGTTLRLGGRGIGPIDRQGDQFVLLSPVIPAIISDELRNAIEQERSKY